MKTALIAAVLLLTACAAEAETAAGVPGGDGMWLVGAELSPGTWTDPGGAGCKWSRYESSPTGMRVIQNHYTPLAGPVGPVVVVLASGDVAFETHSCGVWSRR